MYTDKFHPVRFMLDQIYPIRSSVLNASLHTPHHFRIHYTLNFFPVLLFVHEPERDSRLARQRTSDACTSNYQNCFFPGGIQAQSSQTRPAFLTYRASARSPSHIARSHSDHDLHDLPTLVAGCTVAEGSRYFWPSVLAPTNRPEHGC